jgi:hypothetical protein
MQARRSNDASALVDLLAVVRDGLGGARVPRRGPESARRRCSGT